MIDSGRIYSDGSFSEFGFPGLRLVYNDRTVLLKYYLQFMDIRERRWQTEFWTVCDVSFLTECFIIYYWGYQIKYTF